MSARDTRTTSERDLVVHVVALAADAILFAAADGAYAGNKSVSGANQAKPYDRSQRLGLVLVIVLILVLFGKI